jgi:hypothetical protein
MSLGHLDWASALEFLEVLVLEELWSSEDPAFFTLLISSCVKFGRDEKERRTIASDIEPKQ